MLFFLQIKQLSGHACDNKTTENKIICFKVGTYCLPLQGEYKGVQTFSRMPLLPYSGQESKKESDILEEHDTSIFRLYEDIEEY
jgi:hypothetical protein